MRKIDQFALFTIHVMRVINTRLGDRAFQVAGPRLWNSFLSNLRQSDLTLHQFCRALKTYLFGRLTLQHLVTFVFSVLYKCSYLLTYLDCLCRQIIWCCCWENGQANKSPWTCWHKLRDNWRPDCTWSGWQICGKCNKFVEIYAICM